MKAEIKKRLEAIRRGETPEGYKRTKGMLYPNDWEFAQLNSVLKENKERNRNGQYTHDDVLSVSGELGITNQIELLGRSYAGKSVENYHIVNPGDIVYTKSPLKNNPYGIIKLNKGVAGIVSTLYAVYTCKKPVTGRYLEYYFSNDNYLNDYLYPLVKKGAKNDMKVNNEYVLSGYIPFPSYADQEKIVKILDICDNVIKLKQNLIAEKRKLKKWLLENLINPDSGVRLPGFKGEWEDKKLGELGVFSKGSGISNNDCLTGESPCIKYGDIYMSYNYFIDKVISHTKDKIANNSKKICSGTLLFTGSGEDPLEIGKCVVYLGNEEIAVGGDIIIMTPKEVNPLFLSYQQYTSKMINRKAELAQGYSVVHIYADQIKSLKVSIPSTMKEQDAIADILLQADNEISLLDKELTEWCLIKKALMQVLLMGIVKV